MLEMSLLRFQSHGVNETQGHRLIIDFVANSGLNNCAINMNIIFYFTSYYFINFVDNM